MVEYARWRDYSEGGRKRRKIRRVEGEERADFTSRHFGHSIIELSYGRVLITREKIMFFCAADIHGYYGDVRAFSFEGGARGTIFLGRD
jgi:hypothetical protein